MNFNKKIYTINDNKRPLSLFYKGKPYIIGFENSTTARYVQYNIMEKDPVVYIENNKNVNVNIRFKEYDIPYHMSVDLYIKKKNPSDERIVKNNYHVNVIERDVFLCYPIDKVLGVILSMKIVEECNSEIIMSSKMIEACFIPEYYRQILIGNNRK
jgi:hypothetical protein